MSSDLSVAPLRTASLSAAVATPLEKQNGADLTPDALSPQILGGSPEDQIRKVVQLFNAQLDRVHFSRNRERDLFSFILSMFFTPNRVHFG